MVQQVKQVYLQKLATKSKLDLEKGYSNPQTSWVDCLTLNNRRVYVHKVTGEFWFPDMGIRYLYGQNWSIKEIRFIKGFRKTLHD